MKLDKIFCCGRYCTNGLYFVFNLERNWCLVLLLNCLYIFSAYFFCASFIYTIKFAVYSLHISMQLIHCFVPSRVWSSLEFGESCLIIDNEQAWFACHVYPFRFSTYIWSSSIVPFLYNTAEPKNLLVLFIRCLSQRCFRYVQTRCFWNK